MAAADYRLMTEATGQRIATALENLAGFGSYLTTADVVNNLTRNDASKVASQAEAYALNVKTVELNQSASANRGTITGRYSYNNNIVILNIIFTASVTISNSPGVIGLSSYKPATDTALSCIDITSGISSAITGSVPCGIGTDGNLYVKECTSGHIYAISGVYYRA